MHDIKQIRTNPEAFDAALARRSLAPCAEQLLALDGQKRSAQTELQQLQARRNEVAKQIGQMMRTDPAQAEALKKEAVEIKERIAALESGDGEEENTALKDALMRIPNLLAVDVPEGTDESANVELRRVGSKPALNFTPRDHVALGEMSAQMDFERAAAISGARFVILHGELARLERALAAFMLDLHTEQHGYSETNPPLLVKDAALYGTGQLPKFAEDLFKTTNEYWLIPTAEVSLTNIVAGAILDPVNLPLRMTAHTPCFRSEAGSAGRDTRGMIRQHQFSKVELVSITSPEQSEAEHERMTACAEEVLKRLGLHYRVMLLCAGDTGFSARKTYDIEVWLPSQETFREISSCSNCGDFQARRMMARLRTEKGTQFVHTLNGSALAVGRTLIAVMENYQQADGTIRVPEALVPYMAGKTVIGGSQA
jgi:seryl-tRNA synthetase